MKTDGQLIKELFIKSGIPTQEAFSKKIGVERNTIQIDFKKDEIRPRALDKYLKFFNISRKEFEDMKAQSANNVSNEEFEWKKIANEYKSLYESVKQENIILRETVTKYQTSNQ